MTRDISFNSEQKRLADTAFVAHNAVIVGDVHVGEMGSIWFGVVIRGDVESIRIGEGTNVQDNSVVHADPGYRCAIGNHVTVGHRSIIHGATIEDNVLIGMGSTIMNGAVIGEGSIVGANSLVTEGKVIPPRSLVLGSPAKIVRELDDEHVAGNRSSAEHYVKNGQRYKAAGYERDHL